MIIGIIVRHKESFKGITLTLSAPVCTDKIRWNSHAREIRQAPLAIKHDF